MPLKIHGIRNCDTMKKAFAWLEAAGVPYEFQDYKKTPPTEDQLRGWIALVGWEKLLNRSGTTFRALPEAQKTGLDADKALALMLAQPSMIKRPVSADGDRLVVGFDPAAYSAAFS